MRSWIPTPRRRAVATALSGALLVAGAAGTGPVSAGATTAPVAVAAAPPAWTARVLPAHDRVSEPTFLLDDGSVVGTDYATELPGQGRPWIWSPVIGRRQLGLDGATWAVVSDAANRANIVGTLYRTDAAGALHSTAVRWRGTRPVPLLPDAVGDTVADTTSPGGDVVVRELTADGGETGWLLSPGFPPTDLGFDPAREWAVSVNSARQVVVRGWGPGTIGPMGFVVWQDGQRRSPGIGGFRDWPACVADVTESGYVAGSNFLFAAERRWEAVLWRDGVRTVLPDDGMSAHVACAASGVNEAGHVVGSLLPIMTVPGQPDPGGPPARAVMWRDGAIETLATDTAERTVRSVAVTDRDVVLAQLGTPDGARTGVAVFAHGRHRSLPVPAGLTDVVAVEINERNQVVGSGVRTASDGSSRRVTVVWTLVTSVP
jgi:hypothetical protein